MKLKPQAFYSSWLAVPCWLSCGQYGHTLCIIYNIDSSETYNSGKRKHTQTFHAIHSAA